MKIDFPKLPDVSEQEERSYGLSEVESLLVHSSYCVKETVKRAFRQQVVFFAVALSLIGGYAWVWSRETLPLIAMPLIAWLMSLWLDHHVGVKEVSRTVDQCLASIEPTPETASEP